MTTTLNRYTRLGLAAAALGTLAACSSVPPPTGQMAVTRTTVERAATSPNVVEAAPIELQSARDKLTRAEKAMSDKDYVTARRLAAEAEADARVAESKTGAVRSEHALKQVQDSIRALQEELNRRPARP